MKLSQSWWRASADTPTDNSGVEAMDALEEGNGGTVATKKETSRQARALDTAIKDGK